MEYIEVTFTATVRFPKPETGIEKIDAVGLAESILYDQNSYGGIPVHAFVRPLHADYIKAEVVGAKVEEVVE